MKDSVFFKEGKLTSTSANYLAEIAKERVKTLEEKLSNLKFYSENVQLLGTPNKHILSHGIQLKDIDIEDILDKISTLKSFIAWIREALKAKSKLLSEHQRTVLAKWAEDNNIILPELPVKAPYLSEEGYYDTISIKDKMDYLYLETICSQIGKAIHERGFLSKARLDLANIIENPTSISGIGRDACVYTKTPTSSQLEVDEVYFKLQSKHREYQARLNAIKHKCEMAIEKSIQEANHAYETEYYEYDKKMKEYQIQFDSWYVNEGAEIRNLKIAIPNSLETIYQELNSVTKD